MSIEAMKQAVVYFEHMVRTLKLRDQSEPAQLLFKLRQAIEQAQKQEPVALTVPLKRMHQWIGYLKATSDDGQYMNIPSGISSGQCWELAKELEQFINTTPQPTSKESLTVQQEKQEPVAWMDGYRNIYSLEEKAAGCPEATIPLVPIANQQKTSGSPVVSELHCICGAEWEWHNHDWELVTTPQPQREWVGLTDEDKEELQDSLVSDQSGEPICYWPDDLIEATEAKLKQKNGYAEEKNT